MKKTHIINHTLLLVFFLAQPFLTLIFALKKYHYSWSKNALWLFSIFFGLTFVITKESTSDSVRYAEHLYEMHTNSLPLTSIFLNSFVVDGSLDLYQPVITFLVSRITDNYNILFAIFGFVFGYFYSRNIWFLIEKSNSRLTKYSLILLFVFASIVSIYAGINGVRFYTALQVFLFGFMRYLFSNNKKYLLIFASSFLFHFSFVIPILLAIGYILMGNRWKLYYALFLVSFFISELNFALGQNIVQLLPDFMQFKADYYIGTRGEERFHEIQSEQVSLFLVLNKWLFKLVVFLLTSHLALNYGKLVKDGYFQSYFNAGLLFYATFNILSFFPSVGRFLSLSSMLLFSLFFLISQKESSKVFNQLISFCMPAMAFFIIINIRNALNYASFYLFFGNPLIAPFMENEKSMWQIINELI